MEKDITQCEFHKNRIIFAMVNNELKISNTNLSHKDWLLSLGVSESEFEIIPRGYILKLGDNHYKIVSYISSEFSPFELGCNEFLQLMLVVEVLNNGHATVDWFSGVNKGKPGEEWEPKHYITTTTSAKSTFKHLSTDRLLKYEELVSNIINNNLTELDIVRDLETELALVKNLISGKYNYSPAVAERAYRFYNKLK